MIYLFLNDIVAIVLLSVFLFLIYNRIIKNWNAFEVIGKKLFEYNKKVRIERRKNIIKVQPVDPQKKIFVDLSILVVVLLIIIIIGMKYIFFAAVISDSMSPVFNKNDLVLMQNIERKYNVGDIIIFVSPYTNLPVSHRIVSISERSIKTAGDTTGTVDPWNLKKADIIGKAVIIREEPIVIKGYGKLFIAEDRKARFGPFDYTTYYMFLNVIKAYGYGIALLCVLIYIMMSLKGGEKEKYKFRYNDRYNR